MLVTYNDHLQVTSKDIVFNAVPIGKKLSNLETERFET